MTRPIASGRTGHFPDHSRPQRLLRSASAPGRAANRAVVVAEGEDLEL